MCGLCGVFAGEDHWTDAAGTGFAEAGVTRRRERAHRTALANRVLAHYGLSVKDWQGSQYVLASATGKTAVVPNLAVLWPAAEAMIGRPPDPLDDRLLAGLGAA